MLMEDYNDVVVILGYCIFLVLAVTTFLTFRKNNIDFIRARIFLKKDFIVKSFLYIIISGTLLSLHEFIHISTENMLIPNSYNLLSESMEAISILFLVLWVYSWRKLMHENIRILSYHKTG